MDHLKLRLITAYLTPLYLTPWWVGDSGGYLWPFRAILAGNLADYDGYRTPGYPLFIAIVHWITQFPVFNKNMIAAHLAYAITFTQSVLGLLAIYFVYRLLELMQIPNKIKFFFALFFALFIPIAKYEMIISSESLSIFMNVISMYLLARIFLEKKHAKVNLFMCLFAGLVCAFAVLVRPNNLIFFGVFLASILFFSFFKFPRQRQIIFKSTALTTSTFALPLLLWMFFNFLTLHTASLTPMASISKTLAVYNLFDQVKPQDKLIGAIMQKHYLQENAANNVSRDYVWRAMSEMRAASDEMPYPHVNITNQRVYLANYLGSVSNYLLLQHPKTWLQNSLDSFKLTWQSYQSDFATSRSNAKYDPMSPNSTDVVRSHLGWQVLQIVSGIEAVIYMICYLFALVAVMLSVRKYFMEQDGSVIFVCSLVFAGLAALIVPCFFTGYFPRYGVPFYFVLIISAAYAWKECGRLG